MELKLNTQSVISSVMYTRLVELWTINKITKKKLISEVPSEKEIDEYIFSVRYYEDIRQAYIEFCNECGFDVDLRFEEPDPDPDTEDVPFKEDEE